MVGSRCSPSRAWPGVGASARGVGFSLVEALVSIVIVAVLVGILFPVLRQVTAIRREIRALANLRSNAQIFTQYTSDWQERWPLFTQPGEMNTVLEGAGLKMTVSYFDAHSTWPVALADLYFDGGLEGSQAMYPPGYEPAIGATLNPLRSAYHYPCAFIADPAYWSSQTRSGRSQFRGTTVSEVRYPAEKSLLIESWPFVDLVETPADQRRFQLPLATTDGSALAADVTMREPGQESGDGYQFRADGAVHFSDFPPLLHTINGVRGRDIIR